MLKCSRKATKMLCKTCIKILKSILTTAEAPLHIRARILGLNRKKVSIIREANKINLFSYKAFKAKE